jgi:GntR family transcriptional regulator
MQWMGRDGKIRIDLSSPIPAYRQIVDGLRTVLVEGGLEPGARLPSVRRLAMELDVHFNTVGEAYRELASEGWLDVRQGSGATVIDRGRPGPASPERLTEFRGRLRNLVTQMRAAGVPAARIVTELRAVIENLK